MTAEDRLAEIVIPGGGIVTDQATRDAIGSRSISSANLSLPGMAIRISTKE